MATKTCYMCEKPATSKEHVPPRCFFPSQDDLPEGKELNYRKNLITVPSCDDHNTAKSDDDEFLKAIIAPHWENNADVYQLSIPAVRRALNNPRQKGFRDNFCGRGPHQFVNISGVSLASVPIDSARFIASMQRMACAVYFHHFKRKAREKVSIYSRSLAISTSDPSVLQSYAEVAQANEPSRLMCIVEPKHGENPDIFYYQVLQATRPIKLKRASGVLVSTDMTSVVMQLTFYGGFEATGIFHETAYSASN